VVFLDLPQEVDSEGMQAYS
jgi:hypothetical protein